MRGVLRVYLGASPGVGKTFAMLDEGNRRLARGADVVIGYVETHNRPKTVAAVGAIPIVPRQRVEYRGSVFEEMDLEAILARAPKVVLVDELAHTNSPGMRHERRWQDVEALLDAGIEVITTINIQHLESLNDLVQKITGITQRETVPDAFVRSADQIELVDMSPEALRKRMSHGNVYPLDRIDQALNNFFRLENLAAMRELALLWVADRVDETLDDLRKSLKVDAVWETRERIVVAISGQETDEALVRRAARMAERSRGDLLAVHVRHQDGLSGNVSNDGMTDIAELVRQLDGEYFEIDGDNVSLALVGFALRSSATQIVVGTTTKKRSLFHWRSDVASGIIQNSASIDVHVIAHQGSDQEIPRAVPLWANPLSWTRTALGFSISFVVLPLVVWLMKMVGSSLTLATDMLLCLVVVVVAGLVGGLIPGVVAALMGFGLINYFLIPPIHTLSIGKPEDFLALVVFLFVSSTVSVYTDVNARRSRRDRRRRFEAETSARIAGVLATDPEPLEQVVREINKFLGGSYAEIVGARRKFGAIGRSGASEVAQEVFQLDDEHQLVVVRNGVTSDARQLLTQVVVQVQNHLREERLKRNRDEIRVASEADQLRTSLLRAVSHDLRTPLANIKAAVTSLLSDDVSWTEANGREFLLAVDVETNRLTRLVENLLDLSRLQAGKVALNIEKCHIDDIVASAIASIGADPSRVNVDVSVDLPVVEIDGELLERAFANLIRNALLWSPDDQSVDVVARLVDDSLEVSVIDRGPGIPESHRMNALTPFQKIGDNSRKNPSGVGLGLAVVSGVCQAVGADLALTETPGGGLTVVVTMPLLFDGPERT